MTGRENDYTWSKPYMKNQQVIVVLNNSKITKLDDLKGKKLALQLDSSAEKALNAKADFKASLGKVLTTSTNLDALNELKMGSVDAVLMDEIVAQYNITNRVVTTRCWKKPSQKRNMPLASSRGTPSCVIRCRLRSTHGEGRNALQNFKRVVRQGCYGLQFLTDPNEKRRERLLPAVFFAILYRIITLLQ